MTPVVVVRPRPGCDATVAAARAMGLDARGFPLFAIAPVGWDAPPAGTVDALLIGSANALRHGGEALSLYRGKPAYVVGAATARAAEEAGFAVAACGEGGLQAVLDAAVHRRLLRLAGRDRIGLRPPEGSAMIERVVYASEPRPMPDELAALLRGSALALLHSGAAARHFAGECDSRGIDRAKVSLAAIGPRVAEAAGAGWRRLRASDSPGDAALLALARQMCQEADRPGQFQDKA